MAKVRRLTALEVKVALATWDGLWRFLTDAPETHTAQLLAAERAGRRRKQFLLRLHSRYNKVRAHRERAELKELAT